MSSALTTFHICEIWYYKKNVLHMKTFHSLKDGHFPLGFTIEPNMPYIGLYLFELFWQWALVTVCYLALEFINAKRLCQQRGLSEPSIRWISDKMLVTFWGGPMLIKVHTNVALERCFKSIEYNNPHKYVSKLHGFPFMLWTNKAHGREFVCSW